MPVRSHHTLPALSLQAADLQDDPWTTELLARLPATFQSKAHELQVFQRARGLAKARERKRREAKKAGRRIRPATLLFAGFWLLLTTLPA